MKKGQGFILVSILICASLVLAACSAGGGPSGEKTGGETPVASQPTTDPAQSAQSNAPAAADAYPAATLAAQVEVTTPPTMPPGGYPAQTNENPPATPITVQVVKTDGTTATLAASDLQKIAPTQVTIGQSDQSGYKLSDVLAAAGVTSFQEVVVSGTSGSATLSQSQVTADVILSTVDPNSLQLASPTLAADQSVKGVNKIEVK
jgi:hypothetical protein